jgi:hypothetical protein
MKVVLELVLSSLFFEHALIHVGVASTLLDIVWMAHLEAIALHFKG